MSNTENQTKKEDISQNAVCGNADNPTSAAEGRSDENILGFSRICTFIDIYHIILNEL